MRRACTSASIIATVAAALGIVAAAPAFGYEPKDLGSVETMVSSTYADVAHLPPERFGAMLAAAEPVVIFDVREEAEFLVSRIEGAVRVDPGTWSSSFLKRFADGTAGKAVVFYCSVGVRSSKLAARVQEALKTRGALAVYNLNGGIFRWHNESRPLWSASGPTDLVHPYDSRWGGLVARQALTALRPPDHEARNIPPRSQTP